MIRRFISFLLRCRLEDIVAAAVSLALVLLCLTTRLIHDFQVGLLDVVFILLPVSVLGVKTLLGLLSAGSNEEQQNADPTKFVLSFFTPLAKIMRDWFPFVVLTACYYSLFGNLILRSILTSPIRCWQKLTRRFRQSAVIFARAVHPPRIHRFFQHRLLFSRDCLPGSRPLFLPER